MDKAVKTLQLIPFDDYKKDQVNGVTLAKKAVVDWALENWEFDRNKTGFIYDINNHKHVGAIEKHAWNAAMKGAQIKQRLQQK